MAAGAPAYAISQGPLAAVVSEVPAEEFTPERISTCDWLSERARFHDQVLIAVLRQAPVVPAALACLFADENQVRQYLAEHAGRFEALLDHFDGKEEWLVKLLYHQQAPAQLAEFMTAIQLVRPGAPPPAPPPWLGNEADQEVMISCQEIAQRLRAAAHGFKVRQMTFPTPGDDPVLVVGNWAFLVDRRSRDRFQETIQQVGLEYGGRGFRVHPSGPWAPFSFAIAPPPDLGYSIDELVAQRPLGECPLGEHPLGGSPVAVTPPLGRALSPQKRSS